MTKWGKIDAKGLADLQKKIASLESSKMDEFCRKTVKELAARFLRKVKKRTPVGVYSEKSGKVGGTLRRGWTIDADVVKTKGGYEITILNATEYAPYVEYGHRTANHKGWVVGRFMMTESELEIEATAPKIIEKKLEKILGELLNGQ